MIECPHQFCNSILASEVSSIYTVVKICSYDAQDSPSQRLLHLKWLPMEDELLTYSVIVMEESWSLGEKDFKGI